MRERHEFISVDLQNDFASEGGKHFIPRESVKFSKEALFPFLMQSNLKICEIFSDYRQPRPGDRDESCVPGTWGHESIVPQELVKSRWLKCMNSPIWVRENIGDPTKPPGLPYQNPQAFSEWLKETVGEPGGTTPVVFGLTIDCCVLATLQELSWRGWHPLVLKEGVDHYSGKLEDKEAVLNTTASNWSALVTWDELKKKLTL